MKKSIKTALLFSTLIIGAVETPNVINNTSSATQVIAHADDSKTDIQQLDPEIQSILLQAVNSNEHTDYSSASDITNDDLSKLTSIDYTASGSESIKTLANFNSDILPHLTSIKITNVDMSSIKDFSPLTHLTTLNDIELNGANISSDQLSTLGRWSDSSLQTLKLQNNNIGNLSFLQNISIPNIQAIDISNNQISDFSPVKNQNWTQLTTLIADNNRISDISPISHVNWPNLQSLSVNNNQISDISPISSANWPNLQSLSANNNNISDINSFANTNWTNLTTISASGNHISNVNSLAGKSDKFKHLQKFSVSNNNINDISWMTGYTFSINSSAYAQTINQTVNLVKPSDNSKTDVTLSTPINDITLNSTNGNYVAAPDSNGQNLEADNKYIGSDYAGNYKAGTTFGTPINPSDIDGNDGNPYSSNNNTSNGIKSVKVAYDGKPTSTYSFGFTTNFGIGQPGYFYGAYNLTVNWGENTTQTKAVKVTVKYIDQNGNEISTPQTKTINFTETGFRPDDTTQQTTWNNDWKDVDGTSYSFTSPTVEGYEDPSETQVSGTVNHDSSDVVKTVTYKNTPAPSSSSETQKSSSSDSQSQSSANSSTTSSAQSSSASSEQTSSSGASKESSSASSEQAKPSSEAQSSSASKEATSSASSSQNIPASNESKAASSSSVTSSSSSAVESSATPAETSNSTTVESSHSNNKGTPKKDNVQPKKVETTNSSEHKDAKSLPQTGDQTHQNVFVALGSLLVAISATMLAFVLRRKNK
ncbi:hypothetical protein RZ71_03450 [Apilactobacillus kunkeei]|uniref:Gram-positive cocci surface proteins LPxTG domain-containing protein n=1 Tax=Apilactobacillus kunkeei TaxID=148814 RepID=A0A0M9DC54_9LACO|nr:leucine-rich repeat domain-containing protein [Apilactobacillus kunkeei]KOY75920.1 hypothetical protein RZ71_03450 [Apilactobacillus kunkeei]